MEALQDRMSPLWVEAKEAAELPKAVLVVDDDEDIRGLMALFLRRSYRVFEAEGEKAALRMLAEANQPGCSDPISLVLLDVMMPESNGWQVCYKIKAAYDIPVIMCSACAADLDMGRALEHGADDYLIKPFNLKSLVDKVAKHSSHPAPLIQTKEAIACQEF
jgi:two-component system, OmpR family, response regulator